MLSLDRNNAVTDNDGKPLQKLSIFGEQCATGDAQSRQRPDRGGAGTRAHHRHNAWGAFDGWGRLAVDVRGVWRSLVTLAAAVVAGDPTDISAYARR